MYIQYIVVLFHETHQKGRASVHSVLRALMKYGVVWLFEAINRCIEGDDSQLMYSEIEYEYIGYESHLRMKWQDYTLKIERKLGMMGDGSLWLESQAW